MSRLSLGPIGFTLNVSADETYLKEAAEAEELGYSTIWLPGGQIDSPGRIAKIVGATTSAPVATGILEAGADQVALTVLSQEGQPRPIEVARELAPWFPS